MRFKARKLKLVYVYDQVEEVKSMVKVSVIPARIHLPLFMPIYCV